MSQQQEIIWNQLVEKEFSSLQQLAQKMQETWGVYNEKRKPLFSYMQKVNSRAKTCTGYPQEVEMVIKKEAGVNGVQKGFWQWSTPTLAEQTLALLQKVDSYTEDFNERLLFRQRMIFELLVLIEGNKILQ